MLVINKCKRYNDDDHLHVLTTTLLLHVQRYVKSLRHHIASEHLSVSLSTFLSDHYYVAIV